MDPLELSTGNHMHVTVVTCCLDTRVGGAWISQIDDLAVSLIYQAIMIWLN